MLYLYFKIKYSITNFPSNSIPASPTKFKFRKLPKNLQLNTHYHRVFSMYLTQFVPYPISARYLLLNIFLSSLPFSDGERYTPAAESSRNCRPDGHAYAKYFVIFSSILSWRALYTCCRVLKKLQAG